MVAAAATVCCRIAAHIDASGLKVCAAACSGGSSGGLLVSATARGSIAPMRIGSPFDETRRGAAPSAKEISICQKSALGAVSRHWKVGGAMSGGKSEPSRG